MKKILCLCLLVLSLPCLAHTNAASLLDVFREAERHDPVWLEAVSQNLSDREGVPISLAGLLPALSLNTIAPSYSRQINSGSDNLTSSGSTKGYTLQLSLSQTVFDLGHLADLASERALSRQSNAQLNAATQDLIIRVSSAYFQILSDEDNLASLRATRAAYTKQLDQTRKQYHVGLKTITDVYTAKASYESAVADYIGAEATLATDRENLRAITGKLYPSLAPLKKNFPFVSPQPASIDAWVNRAGQQNWLIRAATFAADARKKLIQKQMARHLPVFTVQAGWENQYSRTTSHVILPQFTGASRIETTSASLNMALPLIEGGGILAATRKAQYDYQVAMQQREAALRNTLTQTRQNYLNVVAGISKIKADREAIRSSISSLNGMRAGYQVGTETLVNVLNQQENVFRAQTQYTNDRFAYINHLLALKQAAGTLGFEDVETLNGWLVNSG